MARFHTTAEGNIPFTAEEETERDAEEAAWAANANSRKAAKVREERNIKLASTDWTQTADVPQAVKDSYVTYRQALRDISNQSGFPNEITWPDAP
jgi:Tfp pilus assembly protein PilW